MFSILYYEYDCDAVCHKNFIVIHSLVYRLGYQEATTSITLGYHKAITSLLLRYQCMNVIPVNIYEFLFHIIFSFC